MINYSLEALINEKNEIMEYYQNSKQIWKKIIEQVDILDVTKLAEVLTNSQREFERDCGGRYIGQEIMVAVGIGQFYSTADGFGENLYKANSIKKAFLQSYCSLEVKYYVREISKDLYLEEN